MNKPTELSLAKEAARAADEKLGRDISVLDVRGESPVANYFVLVSATSHLHVRSLEDAVRERLRAAGGHLLRTDGQRGHVWRVLDYGSLLIHIMDEKTREFYAVERLWGQGTKVDFSIPAEPKAVPKKKTSVKKKTTKKTSRKKSSK